MRGEHYHVLKEIRIPRGTVLHCSEDQSERHAGALKAKGPRGWFEVREEVLLHRGESVCLLEEPDLITLQALEPWNAWPDILPSSLKGGPSTYYTLRGILFPQGTVVRLGRETLLDLHASLKPLQENWFEMLSASLLKMGTPVEFKETPHRYLDDLQSMPVESAQRARVPLLVCPADLSLPQQRAWEALEHFPVLTMKAYQLLCPEVSRRSLQRALEGMVARGLLKAEGKRMKRCYRLVMPET